MKITVNGIRNKTKDLDISQVQPTVVVFGQEPGVCAICGSKGVTGMVRGKGEWRLYTAEICQHCAVKNYMDWRS